MYISSYDSWEDMYTYQNITNIADYHMSIIKKKT